MLLKTDTKLMESVFLWNEKCFTKGYKMFSPLLKQGKYCLFDAEKNKKYATGTYEGRWDNICGEDYIKSQFQKLKEKFTDQGVPVIIGEFAAVRRTLPDQQAQEGHDLSRAAFDKCVVREANARGLVPFYWDRGDGVFDRKNLQVYDELEYNGLMEGIK